jgi:hypothetical protein
VALGVAVPRPGVHGHTVGGELEGVERSDDRSRAEPFDRGRVDDGRRLERYERPLAANGQNGRDGRPTRRRAGAHHSVNLQLASHQLPGEVVPERSCNRRPETEPGQSDRGDRRPAGRRV